MSSKMKGMKMMFIVMVLSFLVVGLWDKFPVIKESIHSILDPTAGKILSFNSTIGMIIITGVISLILTLVQKFTTDQNELRKLKAEQKILQEEMKKYKEHPEKLLELQKKQLAFLPKTMDLTMAPLIYTTIPIILFFRWFNDYFVSNPVKIIGLSWFWAYLIFSIIFSMIFRKVFRMP